MRSDKLFEKRLGKYLGVQPVTTATRADRTQYNNSLPCISCGRVPTSNSRIAPYIPLRKQGLSHAQAMNKVFYTQLCESCYLLLHGYNSAWTRMKAKQDKISYAQARELRTSEQLDVVGRMNCALSEADRYIQDCLSSLEFVVIVEGEPLPVHPNGVVTYIDLTKVRQEHCMIVYINNDME